MVDDSPRISLRKLRDFLAGHLMYDLVEGKDEVVIHFEPKFEEAKFHTHGDTRFTIRGRIEGEEVVLYSYMREDERGKEDMGTYALIGWVEEIESRS